MGGAAGQAGYDDLGGGGMMACGIYRGSLYLLSLTLCVILVALAIAVVLS